MDNCSLEITNSKSNIATSCLTGNVTGCQHGLGRFFQHNPFACNSLAVYVNKLVTKSQDI